MVVSVYLSASWEIKLANEQGAIMSTKNTLLTCSLSIGLTISDTPKTNAKGKRVAKS